MYLVVGQIRQLEEPDRTMYRNCVFVHHAQAIKKKKNCVFVDNFILLDVW